MYIHTWKKYLPVIRILLKRSALSEQALCVDRMDFDNVNRKRKPLCSFNIELTKGRVSPMRPPVPGQNLVEVLLEDDTTRALLRQHNYAISMNSHFELKIRYTSPVAAVEDEEKQGSEQ